ncbi:MAG: ABC transporter substrate-binding protein, partial [Actinomycetota bacterium]|nr:ABC transporter substrate-binding protein [Actinomycetota bacterium]
MRRHPWNTGAGLPVSQRSRFRRLLAVGGAACLLTVAGCAGQTTTTTPGHPTGKPIQGGTATFALPIGEDFSWIFPIENQANNEPWDLNVEASLWRPLYFAGQGAKPVIDNSLSIANPPVWSNHNQTVTITLKHYMWSDGKPVTSRDVQFFMNLERANKNQDSWYTPGAMPDNIKSVSYPNASTIVINLNRAYSPLWFDNNQLTWLFALPQHVWDKTSATGKVGN